MKYTKLYKWLPPLTIAIPLIALSIFFFFSGNIAVLELEEAPKISFPNLLRNYNYIEDPLDVWSVDFEKNEIAFHADLMVINGVRIEEGIVRIEIPEVFVMGSRYYEFNEEQGLVVVDTFKMIREAMFQRNFVMGLYIMITALAVAGITYMVLKKMDLLRRHRRLSVLITSLIMTLIFLILSTVTDQLYLIFLTFSASWFIYYIEWMIYRKVNGLPLHDQITQRVEIV